MWLEDDFSVYRGFNHIQALVKHVLTSFKEFVNVTSLFLIGLKVYNSYTHLRTLKLCINFKLCPIKNSKSSPSLV
jgi:hypothetical protein